MTQISSPPAMQSEAARKLVQHLQNAPSVLYIYGLAGAGKNFVGDLIGRLTGWEVYHADQDLTEEMRQAVHEKRPFTPEMRDRFFGIVAERIIELRRTHEHLVVTQATYKEQHRRYVSSLIPDMDLLCVTASDATIVARLLSRGDAITPEYAATMRANFEPPLPGSKVIVNDGEESSIVSQLTDFYGKAT